ncbi:MAG: hypothetical protein IJT83_08920 [Victivallales bacterium]|nr:hypothetical protein [Victivallales bacterium]
MGSEQLHIGVIKMSESFINSIPAQKPNISFNSISNVPAGTNAIGTQPQKPEPLPKPNVENAVEKSLLAQLDVLLLHAAKNATTMVKIETVKQVLDSIDLDDDTKEDIIELAETISSNLDSLGDYTGRDLADVFKPVDGKIQWNRDMFVGIYMNELTDACAQYSEKLQDIINTHHGAQGLNILEEAMLQCDRRASELTTLAMQFAEMSLVEKDSPAVKMKLDMTLLEMLPEQALKMHGNAEAIEKMRENVAPLAKRLDNLSKRPDTPVSMQELSMIRLEMETMAEALELAMKEGFPSGQNGRLLVDNSLFSEAKKILDGVSPKFENLRTQVAQTSLKRVVSHCFKPIPAKVPISKKIHPVLKIIAPAMLGAYNLYNKLKETAERFAEEPTDEALNKLNEVNAEYQKYCSKKVRDIQNELTFLVEDLASAIDMTEDLKKKIMESSDPDKAAITPAQLKDMENELEPFIRKHESSKYRDQGKSSPAIQLLNLFANSNTINSQICHLIGMKHALDNLATGKIVTSDCVRLAFNGKMSIPSLVEARIHGMRDEDVDPKRDDINLLSSNSLGHGNANTVFELKYNDNSTFVFKPEVPGRMVLNILSLGRTGYADQIQMAQINLCVQKTADALGLNDVMVKSTIGSHNGDYGIFMEKAPGISGATFIRKNEDAPLDGLSIEDVQELPEADYNKVIGRLKNKLNRMEWFDIITGQGDRHHNNYFIHISKDLNVTVKAIDNDMSFSSNRIGMSTFKLLAEDIPYFYDKISTVQKKFFPQMEPPVTLLPDPGVTVAKDTIIVDFTKIKSPELFFCLTKSVGFQPVALPNVIDKELFNKLMELQSGEKREAFIAELKARLTQEAVDATVKRLDEAIDHAKSLEAKGRVLKAEDFEDPEIQKQIAINGKALKLPARNNNAPLDNKVVKEAESLYQNYYCDVFHRDLAKHITPQPPQNDVE